MGGIKVKAHFAFLNLKLSLTEIAREVEIAN